MILYKPLLYIFALFLISFSSQTRAAQFRANHCEFWIDSMSTVGDSILRLQLVIHAKKIAHFPMGTNVVGFAAVDDVLNREGKRAGQEVSIVTEVEIPYKRPSFYFSLFLDLSKHPHRAYRGDLYLSNLTTFHETSYYLYTTGTTDLINRYVAEISTGHSFAAGPFLVFDQKLFESIAVRGGKVSTEHPDFSFYNPLRCRL